MSWSRSGTLLPSEGLVRGTNPKDQMTAMPHDKESLEVTMVLPVFNEAQHFLRGGFGASGRRLMQLPG